MRGFFRAGIFTGRKKRGAKGRSRPAGRHCEMGMSDRVELIGVTRDSETDRIRVRSRPYRHIRPGATSFGAPNLRS